MGLRPLEADRWFEPDETWDDQKAYKARLIRERRDDVVGLTERCGVAADEVLTAISEWTGDSSVVDDHSLVHASRLVADDLCIMENVDGEWILTGAVVCFPSRWSLRDKVGTTLDAIHTPVPGYDSQLAKPTRDYFDRMSDAKLVWRLNWTLLDNAELFQPVPNRRPVHGDPSSWYFRVERQTLRRMPHSGAVLFTIRTYVTALDALLESQAEAGPLMLHAIESAPAETLDYKGWRGVADALRSVLS
jgi:hypothetical protein